VTLTSGHLLGLEHVEPEEIRLMLNTAESFREVSERDIRKVPVLRGKTIVNFFASRARERACPSSWRRND